MLTSIAAQCIAMCACCVIPHTVHSRVRCGITPASACRSVRARAASPSALRTYAPTIAAQRTATAATSWIPQSTAATTPARMAKQWPPRWLQANQRPRLTLWPRCEADPSHLPLWHHCCSRAACWRTSKDLQVQITREWSRVRCFALHCSCSGRSCAAQRSLQACAASMYLYPTPALSKRRCCRLNYWLAIGAGLYWGRRARACDSLIGGGGWERLCTTHFRFV